VDDRHKAGHDDVSSVAHFHGIKIFPGAAAVPVTASLYGEALTQREEERSYGSISPPSRSAVSASSTR
jgi:hypothetical protein